MGCSSCMRWLLFIFNLLVFLIGCACVGVGVWTFTDDNGAKELADLTSTEHETAAYAVMIGGGIVMLISFLGCCGAKTENKCLLAIYFVFMLILLVLFTAVAVLCLAFRDKVEEELAQEMTKQIKNKYMVDKSTTTTIDEIQKRLECCGVRGGVNSDEAWYLWQTSTWYTAGSTPEKLVPESCCIKDANMDTCQKANSNANTPPQTGFAELSKMTTRNDQLYERGCVDKLADEIEDQILVVGAISAAAFVVLFFCVIASICVCTMSGRDKDDKNV